MGQYTIINKEKSPTSTNQVTYRNEQERLLIEFLDTNANIMKWDVIYGTSPLKFKVTFLQGNGCTSTQVIEAKSSATTKSTVAKKKSKFTQGYYSPKYPEKYIGDLHKIRYMSSWELKLHTFLDANVNIIRWSSEGIAIPYVKPTDSRIHKYYPDYYIEYKKKNGDVIKEIIEVKPAKQTAKSRSRNQNTRMYEDLTYAINMSKWDAAIKFCTARGIRFRVITEKELLV